MIEVCSLASGSNGNAFFIKTGEDAFLVDAGISCKQICLRLEQIQSSVENIKALFITHEHSDHIRGLRVLLKRRPIPVYMTEETFARSDIPLNGSPLHFIGANDRITINETLVQALPKSHDAAAPSLFSFTYRGKKISVVTDAGYACPNVIEAVKDAHVIFLETNYDDQMLREGYYPEYLKRRIAGRRGHLSNEHAARLIREHASPDLETIFLSHLSENNNEPGLAMETFLSIVNEREDLSHVNTLLTSRHGISEKVIIGAGK